MRLRILPHVLCVLRTYNSGFHQRFPYIFEHRGTASIAWMKRRRSCGWRRLKTRLSTYATCFAWRRAFSSDLTKTQRAPGSVASPAHSEPSRTCAVRLRLSSSGTALRGPLCAHWTQAASGTQDTSSYGMKTSAGRDGSGMRRRRRRTINGGRRDLGDSRAVGTKVRAGSSPHGSGGLVLFPAPSSIGRAAL